MTSEESTSQSGRVTGRKRCSGSQNSKTKGPSDSMKADAMPCHWPVNQSINAPITRSIRLPACLWLHEWTRLLWVAIQQTVRYGTNEGWLLVRIECGEMEMETKMGDQWAVMARRGSSLGVSAIRAWNGCKWVRGRGGKVGKVWRWRTPMREGKVAG